MPVTPKPEAELRKPRRALWVSAICLISVVALVAGVRGWQGHRTQARTDASRDNLKQLLAALHSYHEEHGSFPPAYVAGPDGERWHSWRALVLPYVDPELAAKYSFDEPWDGGVGESMKQMKVILVTSGGPSDDVKLLPGLMDVLQGMKDIQHPVRSPQVFALFLPDPPRA